MSRRSRKRDEELHWAGLRGYTSPWHSGDVETGELPCVESEFDAPPAVPDPPDVPPTRGARRRGSKGPPARRPAPPAVLDVVCAPHVVESTDDPWQALLDDDDHWDWAELE